MFYVFVNFKCNDFSITWIKSCMKEKTSAVSNENWYFSLIDANEKMKKTGPLELC